MQDATSTETLITIALRNVKKLAMDEDTANTVLSDINFCKVYLDEKDLLDIAHAHQKGALKILKNHPEIFSPDSLIAVAKKFRGASLYIHFEEKLKSRVDPEYWNNVMKKYGSTSPFSYEAQPKPNFGNNTRLMF